MNDVRHGELKEYAERGQKAIHDINYEYFMLWEVVVVGDSFHSLTLNMTKKCKGLWDCHCRVVPTLNAH